MAGPAHDLLLVDDGELEPLAELLSNLGIEYARVRGGQAEEPLAAPRRLLVTTPRRAGAVETAAPKGASPGRPLRIVSVEEDSNALRARLRETGFHMLVRRPAHPEIWRLLVQRALYQGAERRRDARMPLASSVELASGSGAGSATLIDISNRGCRLLLDREVEAGSPLCLEIPLRADDRETLKLSGRVLRAQAGDGHWSAALLFDTAMPEATRAGLGELLNQLTRGAGSLRVPEADLVALPACESSAIPGLTLDEETDPAVAADVEVGVASGGAERREHARAVFGDRVQASIGGDSLVLMGRDLSAGGMRVERVPGLEVGQRFEISIFGPGRQEPLRVSGEVLRDDGEQGLALRFLGVCRDDAVALEKLVACLPDVESLADGETASLGSVITELQPAARRA